MKKTRKFIITLSFIVITLLLNAQNNPLYGSWQSTNGTVTTFTPQSITMAGMSYRYQILGNQISVFDEYGNSMIYQYQLNGNTLYLAVEGVGTYTLQRINNRQSTQVGYGNQNNSYSQRGRYNQEGGYNQGQGSAGAERIYGTFCSYSSSGYSSSSSYSTTTRVYFDGRGHYTYGSESSYSGNGDGYSGGNGGYSGTYRVVGNEGVILTDAQGNQYRVAIYFVQDSGEITELKYDGTVYAKSLCD